MGHDDRRSHLGLRCAAFAGGTGPLGRRGFVPVAAALNLALLPAAALDHPIGRRLAWVPFAVIGVAGLVLETQVPGLRPQLALFALSPIAVWRGYTEPRLDRLPWLAALFGLLTLLLWALPEWNPTGETITVEDIVEAVLPGAWAPRRDPPADHRRRVVRRFPCRRRAVAWSGARRIRCIGRLWSPPSRS